MRFYNKGDDMPDIKKNLGVDNLQKRSDPEFRKILERNIPFRHLMSKIGNVMKVKFQDTLEIEGIFKAIDNYTYLCELELQSGEVIYFTLKNCLYVKLKSRY